MVYHDIDEEAWGEEESEEFVDDDVSETLPCPECGRPVYEDAVQCPFCGLYITPSTSVWSGRPVWWILLGLLGTLAALWWCLGLAAAEPR